MPPKTRKKKAETKNNHIKIALVLMLIIVLFVFCAVLFSFANKVDTTEIEIKMPKQKVKEVEETDKDKKTIIDKILGRTIISDITKQIKKATKQKKNTTTKEIPQTSTAEPEEEIDPGIFSVRDSDTKWETDTELKIFEKYTSSFIRRGKIAPGIASNYDFIIRNNNDFDVIYTISFVEENVDNINMLYKLSKGNNYLLNTSNNWIDLNNQRTENIELKKGEKDEYKLSWKWFESSNDTAIGLKQTVEYKLTVVVEVEEKV